MRALLACAVLAMVLPLVGAEDERTATKVLVRFGPGFSSCDDLAAADVSAGVCFAPRPGETRVDLVFAALDGEPRGLAVVLLLDDGGTVPTTVVGGGSTCDAQASFPIPAGTDAVVVLFEEAEPCPVASRVLRVDAAFT